MADIPMTQFSRRISDITECPICTEVYVEPKVLPCIHTFCLRCIEAWAKSKNSGDKVTCPLCRSDFTVPGAGFADLPTNFIIEKLLEVDREAGKESKCDVCSADKTAEAMLPAVKFCIDCQQNMCDHCGRYHTNHRYARAHRVVDIESDVQRKELLKWSASFCDQHENEPVKLYCFDCRATICVMCFVEVHQSHRCSNIDKVAQEFRRRLRDDVAALGELRGGIAKSKENYEIRKKRFVEQMRSLEQSIVEKAAEIKLIVDAHADHLLHELKTTKSAQLKEFLVIEEELERQMVIVESFRNYCEEVRDKATPSDVSRVADDLHVRAEELTSQVEGRWEEECTDVTFTATDLDQLLTGNRCNLVGKITEKRNHRAGD